MMMLIKVSDAVWLEPSEIAALERTGNTGCTVTLKSGVRVGVREHIDRVATRLGDVAGKRP